MSIFSRSRAYVQHAPKWYDSGPAPQRRTNGNMMRPRSRSLPAGPRASVAAARESVHEQARRSRAEIEALVEEERSQMVALVADSVKSTEERLRGAAENRFDAELARIREAEDELRAEIADSVRAEVAKTIAQLRTKRQREPVKPSEPAEEKQEQPEGAEKPAPAKSKSRPKGGSTSKKTPAKSAA